MDRIFGCSKRLLQVITWFCENFMETTFGSIMVLMECEGNP